MSWPQWPAAATPAMPGVAMPGVGMPGVINPAPNVVNPAASVVNPATAMMPGGGQYTPEQWAHMQHQNWQQWAQWQQQYQQWHQQYGAEYQKSINALNVQTTATTLQPPLPPPATALPNTSVPPPPTELKPPLPPDDPPVVSVPVVPPIRNYSTGALDHSEIGSSSNVVQTPNIAGNRFGDTNTAGNRFGDANAAGNRFGDTNTAGNRFGDTNTAGNRFGDTNTAGNRFGDSNAAGNRFGDTNTAGNRFGDTNTAGKRFGDTNSAGNRFGETNVAGNRFGDTNTAGNRFGVRDAPDNNRNRFDNFNTGRNNQNWQRYGSQPTQAPPSLLDMNIPKPTFDQPVFKRQQNEQNDFEPKRNKANENWQYHKRPEENQIEPKQSTPVPAPSKPVNTEELSEAEKKFDKQFADWEAQFNKWKDQNAGHPDKAQYRQYEKKWETWRAQLLERREQMRRKRLNLSSNSPNLTKTPGFGTSQPPVLPSGDKVSVFPNQDVAPKQPLLSTPSIKPPSLPSDNLLNSSFSRPPPNINNDPLDFKKPAKLVEETVNTEEKKEFDTSFLKSASSEGIPGLDLVKEAGNEEQEEHTMEIDKNSDQGQKAIKEANASNLDALSKGINSILGDQKLLSMLSMVSQNQNVESPAIGVNTVSNISQGPGHPNNKPFPNQSFNDPESFNTFDDQTRSSFTAGFNQRDDRFEGNNCFDRSEHNNSSGGIGQAFERDNFDRNDGGPMNQGGPRRFNDNRFDNKFDRNNFPNNDNFGGRPDTRRFGDNNFGGGNEEGPNLNRPGNFPVQRDLGRFGGGNRGFEDPPPNMPFRNEDNFNRGFCDFEPQMPFEKAGGDNFNEPNRPFNRPPKDFPNKNFGRGQWGPDSYESMNESPNRFQNRPGNFQRDNAGNVGGFNNPGNVGGFNNPGNIGGFSKPGNVGGFNKPGNVGGFNKPGMGRGGFHDRPDGPNRPEGPNRFNWEPNRDMNENNFKRGNNRFQKNTDNNFGNDNFGRNPDNAFPRGRKGGFKNDFEQRPGDGPYNQFMGNQNMRQPFPENRPIEEPKNRQFEFEPPSDMQIENEGFYEEENTIVENAPPPVELQNPPHSDEPLPSEPLKEELLKPATIVDYDHKSIKTVEPEVIVEPVQTYDYRHKPVCRIPLPQRPKWLTDALKNIREFQPLTTRHFEPIPRYDDWKYDDRRLYEDRKPAYQRGRHFEDNVKYSEERSNYPEKKGYGYENRKNIDRNFEDDEDYFDSANFGGKNKELFASQGNQFADDAEASDATDNRYGANKHDKKTGFARQGSTAEKADTVNLNPSRVTLIEDLLSPPGRYSRPSRIVIILRGPPGSGKTFLAKLIKDKEVENGGSAPRILSLDDYFMVEQEKEVFEDGKKMKIKDMHYEYEECMEASYRESLMKSFKKTITDGYFNFIIVDNVNDKVKYFGEMWSFAKQNGFQVYICQLELDTQTCTKRNVHGRTEAEIQKCVSGWEPTPQHHPLVDATSLVQSGSISEVEMEEINSPQSDFEDDGNEEGAYRSKWDTFDCSVDNLAKLDGTSKPLKPSRTMEDFLQLDEWTPTETKSGKKRVRWADLEERKEQEKMRAIGFVVGQTNWDRMMDPTMGSGALTQTKYIERAGRY